MLAEEFVVRDVIAGLSCLRIGLARLFNCPADEGFAIGRRYPGDRPSSGIGEERVSAAKFTGENTHRSSDRPCSMPSRQNSPSGLFRESSPDPDRPRSSRVCDLCCAALFNFGGTKQKQRCEAYRSSSGWCRTACREIEIVLGRFACVDRAALRFWSVRLHVTFPRFGGQGCSLELGNREKVG